MKFVRKIRTADGALHDTEKAAQRHAEKRCGDALTQLAHELLRHDKYRDMTEFLDANVARFVELDALRQDCELADSEPCDGD